MSYSFSERFSANTSGSYLATASAAQPKHVDNYWSIDDILAGDARVLCKFELPVYRLGYLVPGTGDENIAAGTKMELPYWLARVLCAKRRQIVSVELPKAYKDTFREMIRADANVINFQKLGPYYYSTGVKLLGFGLPETDALSRALVEAFLNRFRKIMDSSQNSLKADRSGLMTKLDELEKSLFHIGQTGTIDFDKWLKRKCHKIRISGISLSSRKRRRQTSGSQEA